MKTLAIFLLLLAGCGSPRPINQGAAWEIYIVDAQTFSAWYPCMQSTAVTDFDRKRIVLINEDTPAVREACRQMTHEAPHLYERKYPGIWDLVAAFSCPTFDATGHGTVAIPPPRLIK